MSAYSEIERRQVPGLQIVDTDGNHAWINTGQRLVKLNITSIFPKIASKYDQEITSLLIFLIEFTTSEPPGILTTEVLKPSDSKGWSPKFEAVKTEEIKGLLKREALKVVQDFYF